MTRWTLAAVMTACATALLAQAPPAAPVPPAAAPAVAPREALSPALWQHLVNWEAVMKGATNFYCEGKKISETKVGARKGKKESRTEIRCQMPSKARMVLSAIPGPGEKADPNDFDLYIATSSLILEYDGNNKRLIETHLPPGGNKGMLLLDFISGAITARAAAERFDIKLLKEDANYLYLELKPRTPQDLGDFESMVLVLFRNVEGQPAYLPRQVVVMRNKNQDEETWDFPRPAINVQGFGAGDFNPAPIDKKTWTTVVQYAAAPGERGLKVPGMPYDLAIPGAAPASGGQGVVPTPGVLPK